MQRVAQLGLAAPVIAAALSAHPALGQDEDRDPVQRQIDAMQAELDRIRQENQAMRGEIESLRALAGDQWLTERRAEEIRGLVVEVLADAETRASMLQTSMTGGWNEHFFLASPDGRFKLQLEGQLQFRWLWNFQQGGDRHRQGFEHTRTKLTFRGHVFSPDVAYLVRGNFRREGGGGQVGGSTDVGGELALQDAWMRFNLNETWSIRIGQFKLPFNREELVPSARQLAVERSLVNEVSNIGRSEGIELTYAGQSWKLRLALSDGGNDQVGGFGSLVSTTPANTPAITTQDVEYAFSGRLEKLLAGTWGQFDDFTAKMDELYGLMVGLGFHVQQDEFGNNGPFIGRRDESPWYAWTADASFEWGGANLFAAFTHHYVDNPGFGWFNLFGVVLQGGVYVTPNLELFSRFEYGWWRNGTTPFSDMNLLTIGTNYYLDGHDLKWSTDFGVGISRVDFSWDSDIAGWRSDAGVDPPQVVVRTQLQLLF